jgi:hypothetical protein
MKVYPRSGATSSGKQAILESFKDGTAPTQSAGSSLRSSTDFYKMDLNLTPKIN